MRKLFLAFSFICTCISLKAQTQCDSLFGDWAFTRWQGDNVFVDLEDTAATLQYPIQTYKKANPLKSLAAKDSLEMINDVRFLVSTIKTNGFMKFTLNNDFTFKWHGSINEPDVDFSGTFKCDGDTLFLTEGKSKKKSPDQTLALKIISQKGKYLTLRFPNNSHIFNSIITFKRN